MKLFLFTIALLVGGGIAHADGRVFSCEQTVQDVDMYLMAYESKGALVARLDWGKGPEISTPNYSLLTKRAARKNSFVVELADEVLAVDWSKVSKVEIFEVGDYSDDANGALGINYLDRSGKIRFKGMWMGWGGPMACKTIKRGTR